MVLALIEDLLVTKGLREALPFIEGLVEQNPEASARSILQAARNAGLSFTNQPAFNIVAQLKANLDIRERFKLTAFDQLPSLESLGRAVTPLTKNFNFLVRITGFNTTTGEREQRFVSVISNDLLTPEQVLENAALAPAGSAGSEVLTNQTLTIEKALKGSFVEG